jgi:UDP-N-acetylmuramate: L-alanyl-gamma-D-glutamyl-meso-diaminopimelate ligase
MNVHFIAIGGSAMHNLAIALHLKEYNVTGSDDEIFEPSKGRLDRYGLLPDSIGWDADRIHKGLDSIILGMHARADNPELLKAQELGISIYSYPEYLYEATKDKTRVVIGGSHGKTTITSMILHVLNHHKIANDYMVGAQLEGFDCMVKLSADADIAILEGDEYLSSPIDRRPKFHLYHPNIALISGIAWDHINVFPTFDNYLEQFSIFIDQITDNGSLIYCAADPKVKEISEVSEIADKTAYETHPHEIRNGITYLQWSGGEVALKVFGTHNLQNLNGARLVCNKLGVDDARFYAAIQHFSGASKRLELVAEYGDRVIYKDFAHSPSKLKATTAAVKSQFPERPLVACMELHTFSSLNQTFLAQYDGAMESADAAFVYYNPHTIAHKKLDPISEEQVLNAFGGGDNLKVYTDSKTLVNDLKAMQWSGKNLLMMSSGNFDGLDFEQLAESLN